MLYTSLFRLGIVLYKFVYLMQCIPRIVWVYMRQMCVCIAHTGVSTFSLGLVDPQIVFDRIESHIALKDLCIHTYVYLYGWMLDVAGPPGYGLPRCWMLMAPAWCGPFFLATENKETLKKTHVSKIASPKAAERMNHSVVFSSVCFEVVGAICCGT